MMDRRELKEMIGGIFIILMILSVAVLLGISVYTEYVDSNHCKSIANGNYVTDVSTRVDGQFLCCYYDESEGETCTQVKVP